jgi:hypothetical protein
MNPDRAIAVVLAACVAAVLALGSWLLWSAHRAPPLTPTPAPSATIDPTATPTAAVIPAAARAFRLAGTVVGDVTFAIIERRDGGNTLVRPGQVVEGLGQIVAIGDTHVTVELDGQQFALELSAAPTPTEAPTSAAAPTTPAPLPRNPSGAESSP